MFHSLDLSRVIGMTMFFGGLGIFIGSPIAALLVDDVTQSYLVVFIFSAVMEFLGAMAAIGCFYYKNKVRTL